MNLTELEPGRQAIATLDGNTFPVRLVRIEPTDAGTWHATLVMQPDQDDVWDTLEARALTPSGPWYTRNRRELTVRPEQLTTITALAEHIAWDGVATPELEAEIIATLGLDPDHACGQTLIGETAAEKAHNETFTAMADPTGGKSWAWYLMTMQAHLAGKPITILDPSGPAAKGPTR